MKYSSATLSTFPHCRSPCGGRGLKSIVTCGAVMWFVSLPVWGAWIEIKTRFVRFLIRLLSLPVWGAWIEIALTLLYDPHYQYRRSPCGGRGLKFDNVVCIEVTVLSLPVWGAWIEINRYCKLPADPSSLPVWGAWIEMRAVFCACVIFLVAPRVGGVD